jgi:prepilin-type processing-associated H-X9-DG protein
MDRQNRLAPNSQWYPFSYQVNGEMASPFYFGTVADVAAGVAFRSLPIGPFGRSKITQVRNASEKVMLIEADERWVHDGQTLLSQPIGLLASNCNLLADRHDSIYRRKLDSATGPGNQGNFIANSRGKGNAAFCDGHVEYAPRSLVHKIHNSCADAEHDYPGFTDPTMQ